MDVTYLMQENVIPPTSESRGVILDLDVSPSMNFQSKDQNGNTISRLSSMKMAVQNLIEEKAI